MLLKNVKIINYNKIIPNANVEISGKHITSIKEIDGEPEKTLIPGFINTHVHGCMGDDAMDSKEAVERISKNLAKFGTTTYLSTLMTAETDEILKAFKFNSEAKSVGAKIGGFHIEGPWISKEKKGAHRPECLHAPTISELKEFQDAAQGRIKKITYAPELSPKGFELEMIKLGIMPTVGHTNATFKETNEAIEAGAHACTHLWNAMSGVSNRNPGAAEAIMYNQKNMPELIADLVHVDEDTLRYTIKTVGVDRVVLITDAIRPAGLPDGESTSGGIDIVKTGAVIKLKGTDTIAGSASTMHQQFLNLKNMGYDIKDIVRMTSFNAAKNMGWDNEVGIIKEKYLADMILMDNNTFEIHKVFVNGEIKN